MRRLMSLAILCLFWCLGSHGAAAAGNAVQPFMVAAGGSQPFFAGFWRCGNGSLSVTQAFGPWFLYRSQTSASNSQSFVYNDPVGGGWVNVGVDSQGGYWTMTSPGWRGNVLTYAGTYTNESVPRSQRLAYTRLGPNRVKVEIARNGRLVGQDTCTKG
jgi:hypothetical protein